MSEIATDNALPKLDQVLGEDDIQEELPFKLQAGPKCELCQSNEARYKCPRCSVRTCSVACVKTHKVQRDCDGVRDSTEYVPMGQFDNLRLLNDYRFLEDADRVLYTANSQGDRLQLGDQKRMSRLQSQLLRECKSRGTRLYFAPAGLSKRRLNSTYYDRRMKRIFWRVRFECSGNGNHLAFELKRVDETESLESTLHAFAMGRQDSAEQEETSEQSSRSNHEEEEEPCRKTAKVVGGSLAKAKREEELQELEATRLRFVSFLAGLLLNQLFAKLKIDAFPFAKRANLHEAVHSSTTTDVQQSATNGIATGQSETKSRKEEAAKSVPIQLSRPLNELLRGASVIEFPTVFLSCPAKLC